MFYKDEKKKRLYLGLAIVGVIFLVIGIVCTGKPSYFISVLL
jgi:hypothetical protein